ALPSSVVSLATPRISRWACLPSARIAILMGRDTAGLLGLTLLLQHTHERRTLGDRQGQVLGRRAAGGDTERRHRLSPQSDSPSPFPASVAGSMPRSSSPSSSSSSENASVTCAWLIAMTAFFASASFLPPRL